jgi:hypothetical protein
VAIAVRRSLPSPTPAQTRRQQPWQKQQKQQQENAKSIGCNGHCSSSNTTATMAAKPLLGSLELAGETIHQSEPARKSVLILNGNGGGCGLNGAALPTGRVTHTTCATIVAMTQQALCAIVA